MCGAMVRVSRSPDKQTLNGCAEGGREVRDYISAEDHDRIVAALEAENLELFSRLNTKTLEKVDLQLKIESMTSGITHLHEEIQKHTDGTVDLPNGNRWRIPSEVESYIAELREELNWRRQFSRSFPC